MRKRTSKRRWKARAKLGRLIPYQVIVEHRLSRWFVFQMVSVNRDVGTILSVRPTGMRLRHA